MKKILLVCLCDQEYAPNGTQHLAIESDDDFTDQDCQWFERDCCQFEQPKVPKIVYNQSDIVDDETFTGYTFQHHLQQYLDQKVFRCNLAEAKKICVDLEKQQ
jgi:hypothetical protein